MLVGIPKEIKVHESRVAITPEGVSEFIRAGHTVLIESDAGLGSSIANEEFVSAGATIVSSVEELWEKSELILKVKEPIEMEYSRLLGWQGACARDIDLAKGLNVHQGQVYYPAVAQAHGYDSATL